MLDILMIILVLAELLFCMVVTIGLLVCGLYLTVPELLTNLKSKLYKKLNIEIKGDRKW